MEPIYLKTVDEAALIEALPFARLNGEWRCYTHDWALCLIGDLYNDDAVYELQGLVFKKLVCITPATKKDGFYANIKCTPEYEALIPAEIIIEVENPQVKFAGD